MRTTDCANRVSNVLPSFVGAGAFIAGNLQGQDFGRGFDSLKGVAALVRERCHRLTNGGKSFGRLVGLTQACPAFRE